jgi:hypothetical protein
MPNMYYAGVPQPNKYKVIAAGQTTAQVSVSGDGIQGRDYCSHLIINGASTAAPGAVTLFDGTTALVANVFSATVATETAHVVLVDCVCDSTKGFNITTGTSVSVVFVGRF